MIRTPGLEAKEALLADETLAASDPSPEAAAPPADRAAELAAGAGVIQGGVGVEPVRNTRLVHIRFTSPFPQFAARAANAVADGRFDPAVLDELSSLGMGEDFVGKFIAQCMQDAAACLARIEVAGQDDDWGALRDHAHAIKGVASNVGLVRLAAGSGELMRLPEWQLRRDWKQRLAQLVQELELGRQVVTSRRDSSVRGHDLGLES